MLHTGNHSHVPSNVRKHKQVLPQTFVVKPCDRKVPPSTSCGTFPGSYIEPPVSRNPWCNRPLTPLNSLYIWHGNILLGTNMACSWSPQVSYSCSWFSNPFWGDFGFWGPEAQHDNPGWFQNRGHTWQSTFAWKATANPDNIVTTPKKHGFPFAHSAGRCSWHLCTVLTRLGVCPARLEPGLLFSDWSPALANMVHSPGKSKHD